MDENPWTTGCDACDARVPVEYVAPLGYLCADCRKPEEIERLVKKYLGAEPIPPPVEPEPGEGR